MNTDEMDEEEAIDFIRSTVPTVYGETTVMDGGKMDPQGIIDFIRSTVPTVYDGNTDQTRPVTQRDVDRFIIMARCFSSVAVAVDDARTKLKALKPNG